MVRGTTEQVPVYDVAHWLRSAPVQAELGPCRGGVFGWLGEGGTPEFAYGEITGYYLTWLAFDAAFSSRNGVSKSRAQAAVGWLADEFGSGGSPLTRVYLKHGKPDWRNRLRFSFDLAMVLRGVSKASGLSVGNGESARAVGGLVRLLTELVGPDGRLLPQKEIDLGEAPVPARWSTSPGPFQIKTAAAILSVREFPIPEALARAASETAGAWRGCYENSPPAGDLHPIFYCVEGLLLFGLVRDDPSAWEEAADIFKRVMGSQRDDGGLPARLGDGSLPERSDVVAQALRAGCILKRLGFLPEKFWDDRLEGLFLRLARFISPDGAVSFFSEEAGAERHRNVWSAMFASQALYYYRRVSGADAAGELDAKKWIGLLV